MTRATIITITTLIWSAGFAATGAFVYTVTKPLPTSAVASLPSPATPRMPHAQRERTLVLPTLEIVGETPHSSPPKRTTANVTNVTPKNTDPAAREPHCSEWRPLEQGSNSVQICD